MGSFSDEDLKKLPLLMSEDFAVLLGFKKSSLNDGRETDDELEKLHRLMAIYLPRNRMEHEDQQDVIWCRFCALYLPDLVDRLLNPPAITSVIDPEEAAQFRCWNVYLEMLVQVQHTPYFAKYLRSNKPAAAKGKLLPRTLAERLVEQAPRWDCLMLNPPPNALPDHHESIAASTVQLLSTLLTSFVKAPDQEKVVPRATREALLPWLQKWARRYPMSNPGPTVLGDVSLRTWMQISGEVDIRGHVKDVRKLFRNLENCALPECNKKSSGKRCAKCQTVSYCSQEHQRLHWTYSFGAQHKQLCHATEY